MTLDEYMKAAGLTDEAMARKIDVKQTSVTRYRNHDRMPRPDTMAAIEGVTEGKVTASDFVAGVRKKRAAEREKVKAA